MVAIATMIFLSPVGTQDSIKRQVERVFPDDELLKVRYSNDIFAQCREICVELMREIPADELLEAYNKKEKPHSILPLSSNRLMLRDTLFP